MNAHAIKWSLIAKTLAVGAAAVGVLGSLLVWSGLYDVAASRDHFQVTTWLLQKVREQSIATRTMGIEAPPLQDDGMVRLGASHFESGCAPCHNRPGHDINPVVAGMLPSPPQLETSLQDRKPESVFWIVRHGLKYTGMPAWPSQSRTDEVWALTAFLQTLQGPHATTMLSVVE